MANAWALFLAVAPHQTIYRLDKPIELDRLIETVVRAAARFQEKAHDVARTMASES